MKAHIVEDVKIVRETLVRHIDWSGLGLEIAGVSEDGEQALERMEAAPPDVLVTDIGMAMMDGIELIRRVKARFPDTKCIILSGLSEFQYAQEAIKLGVVEYVLKPLDIDELTAVVARTVRSIVQEREQRDELQRAKQIVKAHLPNVADGEPSMTALSGSMKHAKVVERMLNYVKSNLASGTLSLQQVADEANLSEKYANSIFKETVGTTINHYIIAQKMELAARLLQDPDMKVYEVCERIGYADHDHFRISFKRHHGCTPSEYRNRTL
ncbi:response regulator [Paenibacillus hodogayensis]|uniref:Response regulator n=1 Tax=Paenibacillus hodogayensis TaxID=279208 RepID=A0ABV5W780_9BACL